MARFCSLFSGSDGNCAYVSGADTSVLVDVGRSAKQVLEAMETRGIDPCSLAALLVTHEHADHIKGIRVFLKKVPLPVYATAEVLEKLFWDQVLSKDHPVVTVMEGEPFQIGSMGVWCFDTPHDSIHSVGYRFQMADGCKIALATDMGFMSDSVREQLIGSDLVLLESNYDPSMLSVSSYPYALKQRIVSNLGHLSNEACARELVRLVRNGSTRFILGHLSRRTNLPELAALSAKTVLNAAGMRENFDYELRVAPRDEPMEMVVL